jgi:hypothetical protein
MWEIMWNARNVCRKKGINHRKDADFLSGLNTLLALRIKIETMSNVVGFGLSQAALSVLIYNLGEFQSN